MREFVFGNDEQFKDLKRQLQDGQLIVFKNCTLPACCKHASCRIGFEKTHGMYTMLIDYGITCSKTGRSVYLTQFHQFLRDGEIRFLDFNDLKVFLTKLKLLYR